MTGSNKEARFGLGLAVNTVRGVRAALIGALNFAVDEKLILENPAKKRSCPLSPYHPVTL